MLMAGRKMKVISKVLRENTVGRHKVRIETQSRHMYDLGVPGVNLAFLLGIEIPMYEITQSTCVLGQTRFRR